MIGDDERVTALCNKIILADPAHESATVMLSDALFQKDPDSDEAVKPLQCESPSPSPSPSSLLLTIMSTSIFQYSIIGNASQ